MKQTKKEKLVEQFNEKELEAILKSSRSKPARKVSKRFSKQHVKFGYFSDPHIGSKVFQDWRFEIMIQRFKNASLDFILCPGDHLEGMSNRPGHIYELEDIGFHAQINHAVRLYSELPTDVYGIDGNHDQWYFKKGDQGVIVGEELQSRLKNYHHLGQDEADFKIAPNVTIKLFHANDGSAYALSYKIQKLIESFTGGEKPDIVLSGHYHKALYMFLRNVHGFECGTLADQSQWMRGKKIAAHMGFGIVDIWYNKNGVERLVHEFVPFYK